MGLDFADDGRIATELATHLSGRFFFLEPVREASWAFSCSISISFSFSSAKSSAVPLLATVPCLDKGSSLISELLQPHHLHASEKTKSIFILK